MAADPGGRSRGLQFYPCTTVIYSQVACHLRVGEHNGGDKTIMATTGRFIFPPLVGCESGLGDHPRGRLV